MSLDKRVLPPEPFLFCHVKNKEPPLIRGLFVITFIGREWFILFGQVHGPA